MRRWDHSNLPIYMCTGIVLLLCVFLLWAFLDGVDAMLTQGYSVSWWWRWTGETGQRVLSARRGSLGISPGLPTLLYGIAHVSFVIAALSIATWSFVWLLWRDRAFLKWIAGLAAIVMIGAGVAAGVLSFAM